MSKLKNIHNCVVCIHYHQVHIFNYTISPPDNDSYINPLHWQQSPGTNNHQPISGWLLDGEAPVLNTYSIQQ